MFNDFLGLDFATRMSRIERSCLQYLPLFWPVRQSRATVKHNDIINILGLHSKHAVTHTPISHISLDFDSVRVQLPFKSEYVYKLLRNELKAQQTVTPGPCIMRIHLVRNSTSARFGKKTQIIT